ncbi:MAG: hypothetical protein ABSA44_14065 [Bacteroidota bacterium]
MTKKNSRRKWNAAASFRSSVTSSFTKNAPHEMPFTKQKKIGCIIGKHHAPPMVDHTHTAAMYKRMFYCVK